MPLEPPLELPAVAFPPEPESPELLDPPELLEPPDSVLCEPAVELDPAIPTLEPPVPTLPPAPGLPATEALPAMALTDDPAEPGAPAPLASAGGFESPHADASTSAQHGNAQAKTPLMKRESVLDLFTRVLCDERVKIDQRSVTFINISLSLDLCRRMKIVRRA